MMRWAAIVFAGLCGLTITISAQRPLLREIDGYIKDEMRREQIPGVALAILKNGRVEILRSYGLANLEHNVPVKPTTVFQSGSLAKQFTAAAVMLLVQDGKLNLDEPVSRYLPDAPATWRDVTVRRLLNHTAGLGNFGDEVDLRRDYTEAEFWQLIKKSTLKFEPAADWDYSNLGYVTLGILIHKVAGEFYGDFLARRVFRPLGMSASRVISEADIVPNRAAGYRLVNGVLKNQEWVSPSNNTTADGSLYVTLADLIKWDAALNSGHLINKATLEQIWAPAMLNDGHEWPYGFGWHLGKIGDHKIVFHGGAWQGFKTFIGRVLDDKRTFILLANSWDTHEFKIAHHLLSLYYPRLRHREWTTTNDIEPQATARMRRLLIQVLDGRISCEHNSEGCLPAEKARQIRMQLRSLSLPIAVIYTSEMVSENTIDGHRIYRHLLSDVLESLVVTIDFGPDGKVADLKVEPS